MAVAENNAHRIMADWFQGRDFHFAFAAHELPLLRCMPLDFRTRRFNPEKFRRELITFAIVEFYGERVFVLFTRNSTGQGSGVVTPAHPDFLLLPEA